MTFYSAQNMSQAIGGLAGIYLGVWGALTFTDALEDNDWLTFEDESAMNHITAAAAMLTLPVTTWVGIKAGMALPSMPSRMSSARQEYQSSDASFWAKTSSALATLVDGPEKEPCAHQKLYKMA